MFYIVRLLVCNIQYVLLVYSNYIGVLLIYDFFYWFWWFIFRFRFPFIDDGVVVSESEKYIWLSIGLLLLMEYFNSWSFCIVFVSDSETAFLCFEIRFLINCFCFVMVVFFCVCRFDLIYPINCLCGVFTRSYL